MEDTPDKINKSTVFCNLFLWIFGSIKISKLKNQQINIKTRYQYSNNEKKLNIKSTNQQCFATCYSEFYGLSKVPNWNINKSTGKRAINTQAHTRNQLQNQQINGDLQPVLLNFWVWYKVLFTKSTNQQLNSSTI